MTADIRILQWGGTEYDNTSGGSAIEIWSCSLHFAATGPADPPETMVATMASIVKTYHTAAGTNIHSGCALEYVKVSVIDADTGHWITDPVAQVTFTTANRGASASGVPLAQSVRISLDDGTRDRRARGGFYLPRYAGSVGTNGRYSTGVVSSLVTTTSAFLGSLNAYVGGVDVGIYSKTGHSFTTSTRFRIGDVPDNIRRRKNAQRETYVVTSL